METRGFIKLKIERFGILGFTVNAQKGITPRELFARPEILEQDPDFYSIVRIKIALKMYQLFFNTTDIGLDDALNTDGSLFIGYKVHGAAGLSILGFEELIKNNNVVIENYDRILAQNFTWTSKEIAFVKEHRDVLEKNNAQYKNIVKDLGNTVGFNWLTDEVNRKAVFKLLSEHEYIYENYKTFCCSFPLDKNSVEITAATDHFQVLDWRDEFTTLAITIQSLVELKQIEKAKNGKEAPRLKSCFTVMGEPIIGTTILSKVKPNLNSNPLFKHIKDCVVKKH